MFPMYENKLDDWLNDYESFNREFRGFCHMHFRVHGIHADFVPDVLKQMHAQWKEDHDTWLNEEIDEKTKALSHTKICALLLYNLVSEAFLGNMYDYEYQEEQRYIFRGTEIQKDSARRDLLDAREAVLALDFVILTIDWFERNRIDRAIEFRQPLTAGMRHDLLSYLLHGQKDRKAIYLILEALYLRPKKA
ncbi:hypothetical protein [Hoeflea sp.]|uniref:hypothetical protein n=1 Tax=Hoeflea sp. TaxID=1940281 RepID=UPI003747F405